MGEQSVGKSFALNHLVDTSFAGSAMRTTEGVWMSATPTDAALIVALDFEGSFNLVSCEGEYDYWLSSRGSQHWTLCSRGYFASAFQHGNF